MSVNTLCMQDEVVLNEAKVSAFAERLVDVINNGALNLMISIGRRTGYWFVVGSGDVAVDLNPWDDDAFTAV